MREFFPARLPVPQGGRGGLLRSAGRRPGPDALPFRPARAPQRREQLPLAAARAHAEALEPAGHALGCGVVTAGPDTQRRNSGAGPAALGAQVQADGFQQQGGNAPGPEPRPDHVPRDGRASVRVGLDPQVGRDRGGGVVSRAAVREQPDDEVRRVVPVRLVEADRREAGLRVLSGRLG